MKLSEFLAMFNQTPKYEGNGWAAHCPAHDDSHESLRIAVAKGTNNILLKCRAGCKTEKVVEALPCGWPDLFDLDIDIEGHLVADDIQPVSAVTQAKMAEYLAEANGNVSGPGGEAAMQYALERFGIGRDAFFALGLGYDSGDDFDFSFLGRAYTDAPRLVVPFRNADGIPRGFQARDISQEQAAKAKWSGPSNPPEGGSWTRTAYFQAGSGMDYIVVTEGPGDALTCVAAGVDAVGIRGVSHAQAVVEELSESLKGRRIVLAGDNDRAGAGMNMKLGEALSAAGLEVHVLAMPDGVEDISDWFEHSNNFAPTFQRAVTTAPPFVPSGPVQEVAGSDGDDPGDLQTHVGVAREVTEHFEGLLYAEGLGFFVYTNGVWVKDKHRTVRSTIHSISDDLERLAVEKTGQQIAEEYQRAARRLRSSTFIDNVIKELKAMVPVDQEDFDQHHHLLAFQNGVVDLKTGNMLEHSKEYMLTRQIGFDYDADATCPRWDQFLTEVMPGKPDMVTYLQRLIGYGVTGSTQEQCFGVLWGRGANGKSIFTDTLTEVFQDVTVTTPFSTFEERANGGIPNDLAALRGSRLVFASEGERGKPMAESVIKRVTGQDQITARFMREEFFSFRPTFLILMGTNYKPNFKGQDEGLWRRVKLIPFSRYFEEHERDHYLGQKLLAEEQGIAAWAVRGAVAWFAEGLCDPAAVVNATKNYRDTADALSGFFPDGPLVKGSATDYVLGSDAYKVYEKWCDDEELSVKERWSRRAFYGAMEERGVEKMKRKEGICLFGVQEASSTEPAPSPYVSTEEESTSKSIFDGAR